ncbi:MAG: MarR family transcriptional regulator [Ilumatobacteraceae bacterium]
MTPPTPTREDRTSDRSPSNADAAVDVDRLRLVLLRLARRIRTSSVEEITPSQLAVLATVNRMGGTTIGRIAEIEHVKPPSVSKIVAALERAGYVARQPDPTDRRCSVIVSTTMGDGYIDGVRAAGRTWLATQLTTLDDAEVEAVSTLLPVLERLLEVAE